jgi:predicted helicase
MQKQLHEILLRSPPNLFDEFLKDCQKWYEAPVHTFTEMRTRDNKKIRGDIFEEFCVLYLKHVKKYDSVWRLPDVPDDTLTKLGLKRQDMGIDILAEKDGKYTAIQCKYKKHNTMKPKNVLGWKTLSTFYALCLRTGPWEKYIVMTNCDYVRHQGKKTPKDLSICLKTLQNITKEQWTLMCEIQGNTLTQVSVQLSPEELRAARLARFQTVDNIPHTSSV